MADVTPPLNPDCLKAEVGKGGGEEVRVVFLCFIIADAMMLYRVPMVSESQGVTAHILHPLPSLATPVPGRPSSLQA